MVLEQVLSKTSGDILDIGYTHGIPMGTPSNDTTMGLPYVEDFIEFINLVSPVKGNLLEIGAGTGYLSYRMKMDGWEVTSLEPGRGFESEWLRFGIKVVNDFYPSAEVRGAFECVVMYTVLEHIFDIETLLSEIRSQLTDNGKLIIAVPDCTDEILEVDPAMLIHEHTRYFTETSLRNIFAVNGYEVQIVKSKFGRSIYVSATKLSQTVVEIDVHEEFYLSRYIREISGTIRELREFILETSKLGQIAVYCPARLLNILPIQLNYIFIDDSIEIQGKYYPPFSSIVIKLEECVNLQVDTVIIGSRTFATQMINNLPDKKWKVVKVADLMNREYRNNQ
jgi:SAM-dependent methyltransferase